MSRMAGQQPGETNNELIKKVDTTSLSQEQYNIRMLDVLKSIEKMMNEVNVQLKDILS